MYFTTTAFFGCLPAMPNMLRTHIDAEVAKLAVEAVFRDKSVRVL